jgi:dynein heavy chain 2
MGLNNLYLSLQAVSANKGRDAKMDWEAIHGLMEDAIYGGRIDNAFDTRVLRSYLRYGSFAQTRMEWAALLTLCVAVIACCSVFFSDRLAAEGSSGKEVLQGTPLLMPSNPDFKSFSRLIAQVPQPDLLSMWRQVYSSLLSYICSPPQLPDADSPYYFSLPDNIERSLQRTTSAALIKQLRVLSSSDLEASKYDREKWRAQVSNPFLSLPCCRGTSCTCHMCYDLQLGPILELWNALTSSTPGLINRRGGAGAVAGNKKVLEPVDDFVQMENDLAGDICAVVDAALASLKKVRPCNLVFMFETPVSLKLRCKNRSCSGRDS